MPSTTALGVERHELISTARTGLAATNPLQGTADLLLTRPIPIAIGLARIAVVASTTKRLRIRPAESQRAVSDDRAITPLTAGAS